MTEVLDRHRPNHGGYPVGYKRYYGIEDLKKFKADFVAFLGPNVDTPDKVKPEEVEAWASAAETAAATKFEPYSDLERFLQGRRFVEHFDRRLNKAARAAFFQKKAAELDPPMAKADLLSCPAYQRFIDIPNPPSELSWLQLQKKIAEERKDPSLQSGSRAKKVALARANYHKSMAEAGKIGVRGPHLGGLDGSYDDDLDDLYSMDTEDEQDLRAELEARFEVDYFRSHMYGSSNAVSSDEDDW